ncbi:MAG: photosynthetic complex assembly protein PuhC [Pseudomonadota bacterium]
MSHHHKPEKIPPALLLAAGALIVASVVGVGFARLTDIGVQHTPEAQIVESITVTFKDEADGGVGVYDYADKSAIYIFEPGTGGFVRTAMRALAYKRKIAGAGPEAPFQVARTDDGRLLLIDMLTEQSIGLEAFGDENARNFEQLLPSGA